MYLSRLLLQSRRHEVRWWLSDCHRLHEMVMTGFPEGVGDDPRARMGVLFRLEPSSPPGDIVALLVQSSERPTWRFPENGSVVRIDGPRLLDGIEAAIRPGARFGFRLRANPVRRVHARAALNPDLRELDTAGNWREAADIPANERTGVVRRPAAETQASAIGKRVDFRREEERIGWLARKGRDFCGFELTRVGVAPGPESGPARDVFGAVANPAGRIVSFDRKLTYGTALFEGELRVTETAAFRAALAGGIGPGKAFGCGLLSLRPLAP
ncbi:MAG TPA: type I-E CRISPR-associated protein Cas6/Cse3/CasE [Tepidiformaceae bacterium]|nr:type I-E CRISPR-associated protein Cas6/Cse3/CasE [Tepidiformaceae bacterium]